MDRDIDMSRRLPKRLREAQLNLITPDDSFDPVRSYVDDLKNNVREGLGLCLSGPNGTGKSFALAAIYLEQERRGLDHKNLMWCRARDIARDYEYNNTDTTYGESVDKLYEEAQVLFIDELGRERDIRNSDRRLVHLFAVRHDQGLVTHFTTNILADDLTEHYGEAFTSRLAEACHVLIVSGEDRRHSDPPPIANWIPKLPPIPAPPSEPDDDLKGMTRQQLKVVAGTEGVESTGLKTDDLKKAIREHRAVRHPVLGSKPRGLQAKQVPGRPTVRVVPKTKLTIR